MFSDPAFSGYTDHGNWGLEEPCCVRDAYSIVGGQTRISAHGFDISKLRRISVWVNLLKHLDIVVTPDVLVAYLAATGQPEILRSQAMFPGRPLGVGFCEKSELGNAVSDGFTVSHAYRYGVDCAADYFCDWDANSGHPKELVTMATDYLRYRVEMFVSLLSEILYQLPFVELGDLMPNKICNALDTIDDGPWKGVNDNLISRIEALHAMIVPEVFVGGVRNYCRPKTPPSIKWDPTSIGTWEDKNPDDDVDNAGFSTITMTQVSAASTFKIGLQNIATAIKDSLRDNDDLRAARFCKVLAIGMETVLFMASCRNGDVRGYNVINLPDIDKANTLYLQKCVDGEKTRSDVKSWNTRMADFAPLRKLTPAGAIVIGDLLSGIVRTKCWMADWDMNKLMETFGSKKEYGCVSTFLISEYRFQYEVMRCELSRIEEFKKKGGYLDEEACRG